MKKLLASSAALLLVVLSVSAQLGTAFTFQGRLNDTNGPANGSFDFVFNLYDNANYPIGRSLTNLAVSVTDGQFNITLDFGSHSFVQRAVLDAFDRRHFEGPGEWLEIAVRKAVTGSKPVAFATLTPRQHLMPTPYAAALSMPLANAALEGTYSSPVEINSVSNRFRGQFFGDASGMSNLPAATMTGTLPASVLGTNVALRLGGNAFSGDQTVMSGELGIGTLSPEATLDVRTKILSQGGSGNNTNLVFKKTLSLGSANAEMVFSHRSSGTELWLYGNNGLSGLRNLQGWHYAGNAVSFPADGQTLYIDEGQGRVGVGRKPVAEALEVGGNMSVSGNLTAPRLNIGTNNVLSGLYATIAGGEKNTNSGENATIGGGQQNTATGLYATVSGGQNNVARGSGTVAGGQDNVADGLWATVAGGYAGQASGNYAIVLGGTHNVAQGSQSLAAGYYATAAHANSFIWNSGTSSATTTKADSFAVHASGGAFFYTGANPLYASGDLSCATLTIRGGADLAEPFAMSQDSIQPGSVVVIDPEHPGRLKLSSEAYDHKVAGIVSGAGGVQPGISMIQAEKLESGHNVALSGRVYALVDATQNPIQPGDLLTTSDTPGHAMKASNSSRASGAVLGKAMSPLPQGRGLVLVLVSLQ